MQRMSKPHSHRGGVVWGLTRGWLDAGLQQMVTNFGGVADSISGPVGVVAAGAEAAKQDPAGLFQFAAIINVNLAVINTLPLPVRPKFSA